MNFVSNRNIIVRSIKTGMSIGFEKGVPTFVHPRMHQEVMEKGILPVDDEGKAVDPESHTAGSAQEVKVVLAPEDGYERELKIVEVFRAFVTRNHPADFTAAGMPSAKAITAALGWTVDTREVRTAWEKHRREILHGTKE